MSDKVVVTKKKHKGLKIFLIIMVIIIVLPIAFVFIAFFDPGTKKVSNSELTYQNAVSQAISNGFEKLETEQKLELYISPDMLDGILISACESINQKKWIPKMYCYVKDNNYTFVADLQAAFFKTRVFISAKLNSEEIETTTQLVFKITGLKLGRLPIPLNWVTGIAGNFIKDETINSAFEQAGFRLKCNFKKLQITYDRLTFQEDVGRYLNKLGSDNKFLQVLTNILGDKQVLETHYDNGIRAGFNLKPLMIETGEGKYKKAPIEFKEVSKDRTILDDHRDEIVYLMNDCGLEEANVAKMFSYLIRGFNRSSEEIKGYISGIESAPLGDALAQYKYINGDIKLYNGSLLSNDTSFGDYCLDALEQGEVFNAENIGAGEFSFSLPCDKLNQVLACSLSNVIGTTIPITFKDENNKWMCQYIIVDNVYTGFKYAGSGDITDVDNYQFNIYLRLNVSGVPISLVITTDNIGVEGASSTSTTGKNSLGYLKFKKKEIRFGDILITDEALIESIFSLIPSEGVFSYKNNQFEVNIDNLITISTTIPDLVYETIASKLPSLEPTADYVSTTDTFKLTYTFTPSH